MGKRKKKKNAIKYISIIASIIVIALICIGTGVSNVNEAIKKALG